MNHSLTIQVKLEHDQPLDLDFTTAVHEAVTVLSDMLRTRVGTVTATMYVDSKALNL